jgi:hypothetical protein
MIRSLKRLAVGVAALALVAFPAAADPRDDGPAALIMTYKAAPADRLALKRGMQGEGLARLERMKREGKLAGYRVLFNRYVDDLTWDMMAILDFASAAEAARWREVEASAPAGLPPQALKVTALIQSAPADRMRARSGEGAGPSAYLVIPYDYLVSTDAYLAYVDGYLLPQTDGWIAEKVLRGYSVYLPRYAAGRYWSSLLVLEYAGDEGLAARDRTTAKVRARLASVPSWKAYADSKAEVRVGRAPIVADLLTPGAP